MVPRGTNKTNEKLVASKNSIIEESKEKNERREYNVVRKKEETEWCMNK